MLITDKKLGKIYISYYAFKTAYCAKINSKWQ